MKQAEYIKDLAKYGLENENSKFIDILVRLIEYYKNSGKRNLAIQLQSMLKETIKNKNEHTLTLVAPEKHSFFDDGKDINEFIIERYLIFK